MAVEADEEVATKEGAEPEEDSHNGIGPRKGKKQAKVPYEKMGKDISELGWQQLKEKNIIEAHFEKERMSREKCMLRECVLKYLLA